MIKRFTIKHEERHLNTDIFVIVTAQELWDNISSARKRNGQPMQLLCEWLTLAHIGSPCLRRNQEERVCESVSDQSQTNRRPIADQPQTNRRQNRSLFDAYGQHPGSCVVLLQVRLKMFVSIFPFIYSKLFIFFEVIFTKGSNLIHNIRDSSYFGTKRIQM